MKKTTILFDLDGTLLPMEQEVFVRVYFQELAFKLAAYGFDVTALPENLWAGVGAMACNDGSCSNEEAFWRKFSQIYGEDVRDYAPIFDDFYANEFNRAKAVCQVTPKAKEAVHCLKEMWYRVVLATNPIFPAVGTRSRIAWTGLKAEDFAYMSCYENSTYAKPEPKFFQEVLDRIGCTAEECLMVGNDVEEDGAAREVGLEVFFLTDCLINQKGEDISRFPQGSWEDLMDYIKTHN